MFASIVGVGLTGVELQDVINNIKIIIVVVKYLLENIIACSQVARMILKLISKAMYKRYTIRVSKVH